MTDEGIQFKAIVERLRRVDFWIFDLDNTLYHPSSGVLDQMHERARRFLREHFGISEDQADNIRRLYQAKYGTTLAGLMNENQLHPQVFLDFVHDLDLSALAPDADFVATLERLPGRKVIFTNGPLIHARRVLDKLGLDRSFDAIFDIAAAQYRPKPDFSTFDQFCAHHVFEPAKAVMFDDQARNLVHPYRLGMACVLVEQASNTHHDHVHAVVGHPHMLLKTLDWEQNGVS